MGMHLIQKTIPIQSWESSDLVSWLRFSWSSPDGQWWNCVNRILDHRTISKKTQVIDHPSHSFVSQIKINIGISPIVCINKEYNALQQNLPWPCSIAKSPIISPWRRIINVLQQFTKSTFDTLKLLFLETWIRLQFTVTTSSYLLPSLLNTIIELRLSTTQKRLNLRSNRRGQPAPSLHMLFKRQYSTCTFFSKDNLFVL